MNSSQVIACFVVYANDKIVYQGSFPVSELRGNSSYSSIDGSVFEFSHAYKDMQCNVELTCVKDGLVIERLQLSIPINRTKVKWKQSNLGDGYRVYYRCQLEDWNDARAIKERRKLKRRSISRKNSATGGIIFHIGNTKPEGDD